MQSLSNNEKEKMKNKRHKNKITNSNKQKCIYPKYVTKSKSSEYGN